MFTDILIGLLSRIVPLREKVRKDGRNFKMDRVKVGEGKEEGRGGEERREGGKEGGKGEGERRGGGGGREGGGGGWEEQTGERELMCMQLVSSFLQLSHLTGMTRVECVASELTWCGELWL